MRGLDEGEWLPQNQQLYKHAILQDGGSTTPYWRQIKTIIWWKRQQMKKQRRTQHRRHTTRTPTKQKDVHDLEEEEGQHRPKLVNKIVWKIKRLNEIQYL